MIVLAAVIILMTSALAGIAAAEPANHAKTQVLLYLVGSDLETNDGTGTEDLREIAASYENPNPSELDVVVAFGGADKAGWQGMRVATFDQLKADAETGQFGNGDYLYSDPTADMGSGPTLEKFLSVVKSSRTADRTILILSNHGNSYDGIGVDDKTKNQLKMGDIDRALSASGTHYDPVMFDACLMASVEVGKTVQPYTSLMLGSEEIQRGSYQYSTLLEPLGADAGTDSETVMKKVVDSYIDSQDKAAKAKTMSIIDATKMPAVRDSLNALGAKLSALADTEQGLHELKAAYNDAVRLGVTDGSKPTSVDLVSLLENIKQKRQELSPDVDSTIAVVKAAVIYERHNAYSPTVYGLSIASPDAMTPEEYTRYGDAIKVAPDWDEFFKKMVEGGAKTPAGSSLETTADSEEPEADSSDDESDSTDKPDKKAAAFSRPGLVSKEDGTCQLNDPYGDASVYTNYYLVNGTHALLIGSQPLNPGADGMYHIPAWDGQWYYLEGKAVSGGSLWDQILSFFTGAAKKPAPLLVDMEYGDITSGGFTEYDSWVTLQDKGDTTDAALVFYIDESRNEYEVSITPYTMTNDGSALFGGDMDGFEAGSLVTSYTYGFDLRTKEPGEYVLSQGVAGPDTDLAYAILPDGKYAAGITAFYDYDDEAVSDQFRIITIKDGRIVSSSIGPL